MNKIFKHLRHQSHLDSLPSPSATTLATLPLPDFHIPTGPQKINERRKVFSLNDRDSAVGISFEMPLSPPPPNTEEIMQHGLHHLLQHNSNTSYPQQQYDEGVHLQSNYGSPTPAQKDTYAYRGQQPRYPYQHQHQDSGLGIQYVRKL